MQGLPGDLARSFGKGATLNDVLQILYEHYGVVMMFDTLSKEIYSLKQGSGENVAEFNMCLSQQVQILQLEYLRRIQPKHMEEMKWDYFYEGLNPKYRQMLAHKADGKNPAGYSDLLLTMWKLKKAETRDQLPSKTAVTSVSNVTHSHTSGNLFPLHKLKDNHTFTTWAVTIGSNEVEEDSVWSGKEMERQNLQLTKRSTHQVEQKEQSSLWSISFILPWQSNYTNRKTEVVLGAEVPTTLCGIAQKTLAKQDEKWI